MASFDNSSNGDESGTRLRGSSKKDSFPQRTKSDHKFFSVREEKNTKKTSKFDRKSPNYITAKDGYKEGEILVKFKEKISEDTRDAVHYKLGAKAIKTFKKTQIQIVEIPRGKDLLQAITYYKKNPNIEYAEFNYKVKIHSTMPNDPRFNELWGLHNTEKTGGTGQADIRMPEAWDLFTGDSSIVIGVIDTGVDYAHEDLQGNMWVNPGETSNGLDDDGNGYIDDIYGINAVADSGDPMDDYGHGTHVSGIMGAVGNNRVGVVGVNWQVKIMALKFLNSDGWGYISDAIECIEYVLMMKEDNGVNIKVTNNSWGGGGYSLSLYTAIKALRDAGILFIAAAGNGSSNNDDFPSYPSSYKLDNIISVAATDHNDDLAWFSNYGATSVDLAAPGVDTLSTVISYPYHGALQIDTGVYKTMYFAFGFEAIDNSLTRNDVMGAVLSWLEADSSTAILLVDDDGGSGSDEFFVGVESYYHNALSALGYTNVTVFAVGVDESGPTYADMAGKVVIWFHGMSSHNTLTSNDRTNLATFLDNGGRLFLTGQDIGYDIGWTSFYHDYLHAVYKIDTAGNALKGISGTLFDSYSFNIYDGDGASNQPWPDGVLPADSSATPVLSYEPLLYDSYSGTSMATPHVAGAAALLWGYRPGISYLDVEDVLLTSVDTIPGLQGRTLSSGRVNVHKALQQDPLQIPPRITGISPSQGHPGIEITLKGRRFGTAKGSVAFCPNEPATITTWTDTRIVCMIPNGAKTGNVTITTSDGKTATIYATVGNLLDLHAFIPIPVSGAACASVKEKIYVIGGFDTTYSETGVVQIYNTAGNYWMEGTDKPTPAISSNAAVIDGKVYVVGGYQVSTESLTTVDTLEIYDPSMDLWTTGSPLPKPLYGAAVASLKGKLYVMGGDDGTSLSSDLYEYNPSVDAWVQLSPMNTHRAYCGTGVINGKIYAFGGYGETGSLISTEVYDPATNTWTTVSSMNNPRYDLGGVALQGKLYALGGVSSWYSGRKDIEVYDPVSDTWEIDSHILNMARSGLGGVTVNNSVFALGGFENYSVSNINESFTASGVNAFDLAYYTFNEGSGAIANDSVGGNHGTINGAAWTTGKSGGALSFDGIDDAVQINGLLGEPQNISISVWANLYAKDTSGAELISLGDHVAIRQDGTDGTRGFYYDGTLWHATTTGVSYAGTAWHHFVYVIDDVNNIQKIYVDGVERGSTAYTQSISYAGLGSNTFIGRHGNGIGNYDFYGVIDDVRVYSKALSDQEVQELYNAFATSNITATHPFLSGTTPFSPIVGVRSFNSWSDNSGSITLTWETVGEDNVAGFNLYRSRRRNGTYSRVNNALIHANDDAVSGATYRFADQPGRGRCSYYKLECVNDNGMTTIHGPIKAKMGPATNAVSRH